MIQFQVTNACNLRCIYCAVESGIPRPHELTLETIKRAIDDAVELYPEIHVSFTGGEPLIVPWLFDAIEYAVEHTHHQVGLLSNLLLLKNNDILFHRVVEFIRAGHQVRMSISGIDRDVCNRLSGKNCYDDAMAVIRRFQAEDVYPELDIPLSASDIEANVAACANFIRSLPPKLKIQFCEMYNGGREKGSHVFVTNDDMEKACDDLTFEGGMYIPGSSPSPVTCRKKGCHCIGDEQLYIRSDGAIFPCYRLVGQIGHISEGLKEVVYRRRRASLPVDVEPCRSCPFIYLCACGCHADRLIYQQSHQEPICGPWRKKLIAEMLFEDRPDVLEWRILTLFAEARKRNLTSV